ncbi:hypothetical protein M5362_04540 [Streptomyces sp. Je 1-79]|uniref:hypothetical protein n=1 Tax=Streptomyces sp. Je 1-79 TaxID=2943847 RepID=UPI0021A2E36E|nr:hypothetical protein [Streptomyces sp. Je 1-79]MCT4352401.1 hypothetical protein [Streptomyces sp. Je 1-79]
MARSRYEADQIVFRWDSENAVGSTGFGPVAWSGPRDEVEALFQIYGTLLRANGEETRPALLRVEQRAGVVLIRRTPWRDQGGRESVICHALVGSQELLDPAFCLGLHAWDWDGAELPSARVRGALPVVPRDVLAASASAGQRALDLALPGVERELTGAVAELLRHPQARFTLLDERGDTACAVLRGLYGMFADAPRRPRWWTFASHDTAELTSLRFVFVGRWAGAASRNTERRRVDPLERVGDRAEELAARLVRHHLRGGPEGAVATALREAAGDLSLLEQAERALSRLDAAPTGRPEPADPRGRGEGPGTREPGRGVAPRNPRDRARPDPRNPRDYRPLGPRTHQEDRDRTGAPGGFGEGGDQRDPWDGLRDTQGLLDSGGSGVQRAGLEDRDGLRDPGDPRAGREGRGASGLYRSDAAQGREPSEPPDTGRGGSLLRGAPERGPDGPRESREAPGLPRDFPDSPGMPHEAREARETPSLYRDHADSTVTSHEEPSPETRATSSLHRDPAPEGEGHASGSLDAVAPAWQGPEARRSWWGTVRSWRRGKPVETGLVRSLADRAADAEARVRAGGDGELLTALRGPQSYRIATLLMHEVARRVPTWPRPLRREFRDLVIAHELFVTAPGSPLPGDPTDAERAANAAALHRWAVRPLLDEGDAPATGVLVALLIRLRSSPVQAARSAFRQIVEGERPGLPEEVWQALLHDAATAAAPPRPTAPPAPTAPASGRQADPRHARPAPDAHDAPHTHNAPDAPPTPQTPADPAPHAPTRPPNPAPVSPAAVPPSEPSGGDGRMVALTLLAVMVTLLAVIVAYSVT